MKLGLVVESEEDLTWPRWRRLFTAAEALGFESIWLSDHHLSLHDPRREALETWTALAVAAAETSRIRLGPLVTPITFRHPALLARQAVALDRLSGGRFVLGLGAGWNEVEHLAFGLDFPPLAERFERLEEGLEVIRRLSAPGPVHFAGRHFRLDGADSHPKPSGSRLPVLIGGGGERRTLPLVARYADEWDVSGGLSPEELGAKCARLDELCRVVGRDPTTILRSVSTAYLVYRDESERRRRIDALRRIYSELAARTAEEAPTLLRAWNWRIGSPDQLAADFRALAATGAERIILQHNDPDDIEALEILADDVLPMLAVPPDR